MGSMQSNGLIKSIKNFRSIFIILFTIFLGLIIEPYFSLSTKEFFYSISNFIRAILLFLLPILILPYIVTTFTRLKSQGIIFVAMIFILLSISNFVAILIGYVGNAILIPDIGSHDLLKIKSHSNLMPLFEIKLPELFSIEKTILLGFALGIILGLVNNRRFNKIFDDYYKIANYFFQKIILPIIPIYIFGVILKINYETELKSSLGLFGNTFFTIILIQSAYLFLLFLISSNFNIKLTIEKIKNSLPAGLASFSTMSRLISLPFILKAAEKNSKNSFVAKNTEPLIMNAHALGECISLPIIILTVLKINNMPLPDFTTYLNFTIIMVLAQFSSVSIPGGSLIVLMPFLDSYFGFNKDMITLMFAFDIFFDSVGTAMNTFGDLAFISLIEKIWDKFPKLNKNIGNKIKE